MAIVAKFKGHIDAGGNPLEYNAGIPARDLEEAEFEAMNDHDKRTILHSPLYDLRRDAPKLAEAAEKRVQADEPPTPDAPKDSGKK